MAERFFTAGVVDEDAAHALGGGEEEVGAVFPGGLFVAAEAEPGFVDEGGGLKGLAGGFAGEFGGGEAAEFAVDEREEFVGCARVALADALEEERDRAVLHGRGAWWEGAGSEIRNEK